MWIKIRNSFAGLLTLVLIISIFSQSAAALSLRRKQIEYRNPWSFQIAIDEKLDEDEADDFNGLRLSVKRNYNKHSALRINLGIVERDIYNEENRLFYTDGMSIRMNRWRPYEFDGASLSVQYMFYPSPNDKVNFFWGIGPVVSAYETDSDIDIIFYNDFPYNWVDAVGCDNFTKVGLGVEGSCGLEWFLGRNISLLAEYGFILQNEWYFFELDYYDYDGYGFEKTKGFDDGVHFDASRIKLGLAVYF